MAGDLVFRRELQFYDENIPCLAACPVHTNAGMYVAAIADDHDRTDCRSRLIELDGVAYPGRNADVVCDLL